MTDKILGSVIHNEVQKMLEKNQNTILSHLAGNNPSARIDPDVAMVVIRSVTLSVQMAVQLTIRMLESAGAIESVPDFVAIAQMVNEEIARDDSCGK